MVEAGAIGQTGSPLIEVEHLSKQYLSADGRVTQAIGDVSFTQDAGTFLAVVGPSGCGKTTLLKCLAGLMPHTGGEVRYSGEPIRDVPEGLSIVFQEYTRSLMPWLDVRRNVEFPLRHEPRPVRAERAARALSYVHLEGFESHYPWQLSGGMQQRVAIARAIVSEPTLLLMDEPFASVDAQTRVSLEMTTLELFSDLDLSVLLITHDIDEAIFMADRVLVLSPRPSRVLDDILIELDRPRDPVETLGLPLFQVYRKRIHRLIRDGAEMIHDGSSSRNSV